MKKVICENVNCKIQDGCDCHHHKPHEKIDKCNDECPSYKGHISCVDVRKVKLETIKSRV
jgi:hypothetical protein